MNWNRGKEKSLFSAKKVNNNNERKIYNSRIRGVQTVCTQIRERRRLKAGRKWRKGGRENRATRPNRCGIYRYPKYIHFHFEHYVRVAEKGGGGGGGGGGWRSKGNEKW